MSRTSVKRWMRYLEEKGWSSGSRQTRAMEPIEQSLPLAIKAVFYHPTKGAIEDDDSRGRNGPGGRVSNDRGGSVDETGGASTCEPPIEQQLEQQYEDIESTPAMTNSRSALNPPEEEVTPLELATFIASEWVTRAHATPLRGGRPSEANVEKAMKLALESAVEGQTPINVWREIFDKIDGSDFLQGKVPGRDNRPPFKLTLSFLLEKRNFVKTLEGRFDGHSTGERRRGSTSQATGNFLNRLRSGQGRAPEEEIRAALSPDVRSALPLAIREIAQQLAPGGPADEDAVAMSLGRQIGLLKAGLAAEHKEDWIERCALPNCVTCRRIWSSTRCARSAARRGTKATSFRWCWRSSSRRWPSFRPRRKHVERLLEIAG
jgi:hypothetical protein